MLFSSKEFIFYFLPSVFVGYLVLGKLFGRTVSGWFLAISSLFFYAWWKPIYLPLILASIAVNFAISKAFFVGKPKTEKPGVRKTWLIAGIVFNLGLLGYFKYSWFVVETSALIIGSEFRIEPLILPLAISFFTFQQIAYLVDAWKGEITEIRFGNYVLFVSFFPQLIAGPIVHHREMMPQFSSAKTGKFPGWVNIQEGLRIFLIGLGKKLILADSLAVYADLGWSDVGAGEVQLWAAWATTLCYTFQLYFDFSGYSDMALGAARIFGIHLPLNFNAPYKARNIQDFWSRWHMTLSRWLKEYVYIPFGGNRKGTLLTYRNVFLTFLLGGIWHGAGWTFIVWGTIHGIACIVHRVFTKVGMKLPVFVSWMLTFLTVHIGWVFFRAPDLKAALAMLRSMIGERGTESVPAISELWEYFSTFAWLREVPEHTAAIVTAPTTIPFHVLLWIGLAFAICLGFPTGIRMVFARKLKFPCIHAILFSLLALASALFAIRAEQSPFLYFNF